MVENHNTYTEIQQIQRSLDVSAGDPEVHNVRLKGKNGIDMSKTSETERCDESAKTSRSYTYKLQIMGTRKATN